MVEETDEHDSLKIAEKLLAYTGNPGGSQERDFLVRAATAQALVDIARTLRRLGPSLKSG